MEPSAALFRRAACYVERILKGARPGDLPIDQPMTFDLAVKPESRKNARHRPAT
jgi:putative ABC transport system substrate-binding protein